MQYSNNHRDYKIRFLAAALAINLLLGVLYAWSLVLGKLESSLDESRAALSFVPALGLVCFTVGVLVHDTLIRRLSLPLLASAVMVIAGLGHVLYWLIPSYLGLLFGYGAMFGSAAGIGYGLALALARSAFTPTRGWAVGLAVAAFAASGMLFSALGVKVGLPEDVPTFFGTVGFIFLTSALALGFLLRGGRLALDEREQFGGTNVIIERWLFLCLAFGFFALCYPGLLIVGHGVALLGELGVSVSVATLSPFFLNTGYIVGALMGGVVAARVPNRAVPLAFLFASTISAFLLTVSAPNPIWMASIFVIGLGFGSTVSVFMMLLTSWYGTDRAGYLFGRLNIGYGLAGFLAPSISGWLYDRSGDYNVSLWLCGSLGIVGLFAVLAARNRGEKVDRSARET